MTLVPAPPALLREHGYRMTEPRRAVLGAIARSPRPFTIEELCERLPEIGRATVFRTVKLLQELEVVCRVPFEDGSIRYQHARSDEHHHHFICRSCGSVTEFSDASLDAAILEGAAAAGFQLDGHSVELYGHCDCCRD